MTSDTRIFPFAIAAGGMQLVPVHGERFLVKATTGPVNIRWTGGYLTLLEAGQGYIVRRGFDQLTLTNPGAGAIAGTIQIADDDFIDNRIAGTVNITGGTAYTPTAPVVGTATVVLLAANPSRKYTLIQNNHATGNLWLGFGVPAVIGVGPKLKPDGGNYESPVQLHLGSINAICDVAGNSLVSVLEG